MPVTAATSTPEARRLRDLAIALGLLAAGILIGSWALRASVPLPADDRLAARAAFLTSGDEPVDVLVIGSSTLHNAFVPAVFDAELARAGVALRSFNLGVPGAYQFEIDHLLATLLPRMDPPPRWVVVEPLTRPIDELIPAGNAFTDRVVYWHTPAQTAAVLAALWEQPRPAGKRAGRAWGHVRHATWRFVALGQADRVAARILGLGRAEREGELRVVRKRRGFRPLRTDDGQPPGPQREGLLANPGPYRAAVAQLAATGGKRPGATRTLPTSLIRRQIERIRAVGAEPIFLLTPILAGGLEVHGLHRAGVIPTLMAFDAPQHFPELYALEHRYDPMHLNVPGAALFTRAFAHRFAKHLTDHPD